MSAEVIIDESLFEKLSNERICTPYITECGKPAQWLCVKNCCGAEFPLCDEHKRLIELGLFILEATKKTSEPMACVFCDAVVAIDEVRWVKL